MLRDLEHFREATRAWLEAESPESLRHTRQGRFDGYWGGRKCAETNVAVLGWRDLMVERGWTAPTWPTACGGGGLTQAQGLILDEELRRLGLPPPLVGFGLAMLGPVLLAYGTEEQKRRHLPAICRGEIRWCQGYSEPGSGSDLASLSTRAERDGEDFVVNGQKVWTSHADKSDWIFCLVRTDTTGKKQAGITFLLIDMETPGVSTRPIELISGASPFCETFFEDVRVPVENALGDIHGGWTVAKALLGHERTMIGEAMGAQMLGLEEALVARARTATRSAEGALSDGALRSDIARVAMTCKAFDLTVKRILQGMDDGREPGAESSILKVCGSALKQARWELAVRIAGPDGLGWEGPGFSEEDLTATREWLRSRGNSIEGGTSEIQLNIIAKHVLGLPT